jgi:hypothetical protein
MIDPNTDSHTGSVDFGNYCVTSACTRSWNSAVRSYWSGDTYSGLKRNYAGDNWKCDEWFSGLWTYGDADACGQNSNSLLITPP